MDAKLAKGMVNHQVRTWVDGDPFHEVHNQVLSRLVSGKSLRNPTGVAANLRRCAQSRGIKVVDCEKYTTFATFRASWTEGNESAYYNHSSKGVELARTDDTCSMTISVHAFRIDEKQSVEVNAFTSPFAIRHPAIRWLERQPGAVLGSFEAGMLELTPTAALLNAALADNFSPVLGVALPMGEGLLMGDMQVFTAEQSVCRLTSVVNTKDSRYDYGYPLAVIPVRFADSRVLANGDQKIGYRSFSARTFLGPCELSMGQQTVRRLWDGWFRKHGEVVRNHGWRWLAALAFVDDFVAPPPVLLSVIDDLRELVHCATWQEHITAKRLQQQSANLPSAA
jgi:hypothetical protein